MNSLFTKILAWFLATAAISAGAVFLIVRLGNPELADRDRFFRRPIVFQSGEAQHAYEAGGTEALRAFLERLQPLYGRKSFFTDSRGRDLLTGEDRSELVQAAVEGNDQVMDQSVRYIGGASGNGRYWLFVPLPLPRLPPDRALLWTIPIIAILCYALARYLTAPVRGLEKAVQRFGTGDLSARVASNRSDELGQLATSFDKMAERIETLISGQRRLLVDISHELRSPLTRLGLAVELARSEHGDNEALDRIQKEADRLNSLIGEILWVTRSESNPPDLQLATVRLDQLLTNLVEISSLEASSRSCRLSLVAPKPVSVQGDEKLLWRAFENVMRNAIRYAPENTPVEIHLDETDSWAFVQVRDHGMGVPEESLPRLFDAFYRVENHRSRSSGGVGLGLAIAHRSIDLHRGQIRAQNMHPGLQIEIRLPLPPNTQARTNPSTIKLPLDKSPR